MDTAQYLKDLANAEKKQKLTELNQQKAQALTEIGREEALIKPQFTAQKQSANVQSQLGAKNFAEFLASRGQTRAGLSTQAELSRENVLGRTLGGIQTAENTAMQDIANARTDVGNNFQNNLTNVNADIERSLRNSLFELTQQREAEKKASRSGSGGSYGGSSGEFGFTDTPEQPTVKKGQLNGMPKSTNQYGVFSNGFQPKGITGHGVLKKSGDQVKIGNKLQNVWKATDGTTWYWDSATRTYKTFKKQGQSKNSVNWNKVLNTTKNATVSSIKGNVANLIPGGTALYNASKFIK